MLVRDACWAESADVIVVGYGGAGAVAAISAHDLGASVLLIEKQPANNHYTNTQMSGGAIMNVNDPDKAMAYIQALYQVDGELAWTDTTTLRTWAHACVGNIAWLESLGAKGKIKLVGNGVAYRHLPGWDAIDYWEFAGCGLGLHRFLNEQVKQRGIRVLYESPAKRLLTDREGRLIGVRVQATGAELQRDVHARRAVIMTTGGFEFDDAMKLNYLRVYPSYFYGTPANTGDGHRMVMELGADLWHMNCCSARLVAKFDDFPIAFSVRYGGKRPRAGAPAQEPAGFIVVDRDGRRFTSENFQMHTAYYELTLFDSHRLLYPRVPCFWIFDTRRMNAGPLPPRISGPSGPVQLYRWSLDNQKELAKGWIVEAGSIPELAEKLGIPAENMVATVDRYNEYCARGEDPEFHRRPRGMGALRYPPFYAVRMYPGGPNTQGGPRHNHRAQVLHVSGEPISRLYAAGELGSTYAMVYPSFGGSIGECIAFGRIAAENAVREAALE